LIIAAPPARRFPLVAALAIVLATLAACAKSEPDAPAAPPPMKVGAAAVLVRDVPETLELVGQTLGSSDIEVRPRVSGIVTSMTFSEGKVVHQGDPLYRIDERELQERVAAAEGQLAAARTRLADAENQRRRYEPLAKINAISQLDVERARASEGAARGEVAAAAANAELARINLGYATVTAPIDGLIGISSAKVGDYVGSIGTSGPLTTVSKIDPIHVRFSISERDYLDLSRRFPPGGQERDKGNLELTLADGSLYEERGTVNFADRQIDPKTGTLTVEASFPNPKSLLRPGQFARVKAPVTMRRDALLVPQRAVVELQGIYHVFVAKDGKAEMRRVVPGQRAGTLWVMEQGLERGERVIVDGLQRLRAGAAVEVTDVGAEGDPAAAASAGKAGH
jgi:membrane fusion protein (multidrug efflux system)